MIIGSYNVENLFSRPKAMNVPDDVGAPLLAAQAELQTLLELPAYGDAVKVRILELLRVLGLEWSDSTGFAVLRKIRGQLLRRPKNGPVEVVADGRGDWIGWVELVKVAIDAQAMQHTAMVIRDIGADILGVVEAENRPALDMFSAALLREVGAAPYEQVMVIDGNDTRGIDVGVMATGRYPLDTIRSHIFDRDDQGQIFSRDCPEFTFSTPGGNRITVLVNHFKSKGYSSPGDRTGAKRRSRQATRVAQIYHGLVAAGGKHIAVLGDLNDDPGSAALAPCCRTPICGTSAPIPTSISVPGKARTAAATRRTKSITCCCHPTFSPPLLAGTFSVRAFIMARTFETPGRSIPPCPRRRSPRPTTQPSSPP